MENPEVSAMWDKLLELGISEQTLQIISDINGYTKQTMLDVLYVHTGYRNFEQMEGKSEDDDDDIEDIPDWSGIPDEIPGE